jgi:hypothetical protein
MFFIKILRDIRTEQLEFYENVCFTLYNIAFVYLTQV